MSVRSVQQLLLLKAEENTTKNDNSEVDKLVSEYRQALLINGYKERLIKQQLDTLIEQKEIADTTGSLAEFLEDVALATDLDKETGDEDKVALMTVHLAKGLEFPYVFIVGMEEDLFPSAMSMNTRSELEEERRLFYVAITRAEKQAYLTYTQSRYRWGKLIDAEPSRFIEEIDQTLLRSPDIIESDPLEAERERMSARGRFFDKFK